MSNTPERLVTGEEHVHCWHGTGVVLESYPPQYPEVCCHCGEMQTRRGSMPTPEGHGPFLPRNGSHFGRVMGQMFPDASPLLEAMELDSTEFDAKVQREREAFEKKRQEDRARFERRRVAMGFSPRPPEDW
jgi:hypothetical protein